VEVREIVPSRRRRTVCAVALLVALLAALTGCAESAPDARETARNTDEPARGTRQLARDGLSASRSRYEVRGVFERDMSATGFDDEADIGFNHIDSGPYEDSIAPLAARGLKGFIWLGGYSNTTCTFEESDDWIRSHVSVIAGHPGVGAYFVDDEPDASKCPSAPDQMRARSDLIKSLDPGSTTFLVTYHVDQLRLFAGTVDVLGLNKYPCSYQYGCRYHLIERQAAEADRLGVRYWGVIQAHGDEWYKVPTRDELHRQFELWRRTNMQGYLVFSWRWPEWDPSLWLANNPELQSQLAEENGVSRAAPAG
jgi:hypothetical protein